MERRGGLGGSGCGHAHSRQPLVKACWGAGPASPGSSDDQVRPSGLRGGWGDHICHREHRNFKQSGFQSSLWSLVGESTAGTGLGQSHAGGSWWPWGWEAAGRLELDSQGDTSKPGDGPR